MSSDILAVTARPVMDNRIISSYHQSFTPYSGMSLKPGEEVRIHNQNQDLITYFHDSYIKIKAKFIAPADKAGVFDDKDVLHRNWPLFFFDEIILEINGVEIDRCKSPGITCAMKAFVSLNRDCNYNFMNGEAYKMVLKDHVTSDSGGEIEANIPCSYIFGFAEDFKHVMFSNKLEIIFKLAKDFNRVAVLQPTESVQLESVKLYMNVKQVNEYEKIKFINILGNANYLPINFRAWELYEYPELPRTSENMWSIKSSSQLEKPRFIIFGLQTNRKSGSDNNPVLFDHCNLTDVKLYLNQTYYPYESFNIDMSKKRFSDVYWYYKNFKSGYYNEDYSKAPAYIKEDDYSDFFLICWDVCNQVENLKVAPIDVRIDFQSKKAIPAKTAAFALIIQDRQVEYSPFQGIVRKIV